MLNSLWTVMFSNFSDISMICFAINIIIALLPACTKYAKLVVKIDIIIFTLQFSCRPILFHHDVVNFFFFYSFESNIQLY